MKHESDDRPGLIPADQLGLEPRLAQLKDGALEQLREVRELVEHARIVILDKKADWTKRGEDMFDFVDSLAGSGPIKEYLRRTEKVIRIVDRKSTFGYPFSGRGLEVNHDGIVTWLGLGFHFEVERKSISSSWAIDRDGRRRGVRLLAKLTPSDVLNRFESTILNPRPFR